MTRYNPYTGKPLYEVRVGETVPAWTPYYSELDSRLYYSRKGISSSFTVVNTYSFKYYTLEPLRKPLPDDRRFIKITECTRPGTGGLFAYKKDSGWIALYDSGGVGAGYYIEDDEILDWEPAKLVSVEDDGDDDCSCCF